MGKKTGAKTVATKRPNSAEGQWYWHTVSGSDIVADGGEGYHNLGDSVNGYLASQGVTTDDRATALKCVEKIKISLSEYQIIFDRELFDAMKKDQKQNTEQETDGSE